MPNLQGNIDWGVYGSELRDRIVKALSEIIMPDLESHVTADFWMHPGDFENNIARRMEQAFLSRRCSGNQHGSDITIGIRISAIFILLARERIQERDCPVF